MAHATARDGYHQLVERLNRFPQGAPPSDLLLGILRILMDEREARLISCLPIRPFRAERAADAWGVPVSEARRILDRLASRTLLLDIEQDGATEYVLPPPMAGFFEFSMMRLRGDVDQKVLAELFYQYLNVEEEFIRQLFVNGETQLGRVFVREEALPEEAALHVLDYERASAVARNAGAIGIGLCYCRHKMQHLGRACAAPLDICMTFNNTAASLIRHGYARRVDAAECLDLLQQAGELGLVQFGENVQRRVNFICNCCGCCCEAMIAARKFGQLRPVHTTNYIATLDTGRCSGCGRCETACPVGALTMEARPGAERYGGKIARLDESLCLGCGVCVRSCGRRVLRLAPRPQRVITPVDSTHRVVAMAIERGKLQYLIFDQQALASHRAMAAILGVILRLPLVHRALASRQVKSRYLETLIERYADPGPADGRDPDAASGQPARV